MSSTPQSPHKSGAVVCALLQGDGRWEAESSFPEAHGPQHMLQYMVRETKSQNKVDDKGDTWGCPLTSTYVLEHPYVRTSKHTHTTALVQMCTYTYLYHIHIWIYTYINTKKEGRKDKRQKQRPTQREKHVKRKEMY